MKIYKKGDLVPDFALRAAINDLARKSLFVDAYLQYDGMRWVKSTDVSDIIYSDALIQLPSFYVRLKPHHYQLNAEQLF